MRYVSSRNVEVLGWVFSAVVVVLRLYLDDHDLTYVIMIVPFTALNLL